MTNYIPTYLYIKQHSVTKKLYFGKTTKDPEKYIGSGKHWRRHIKKHGVEYIETHWYCLFLEQDELTKFALMFSKQQNIVESKEWLNLIPENGLYGGCAGVSNGSPSTETRMKLSAAMTGKSPSTETKRKISTAMKGKSNGPHSNGTKLKISATLKGIPRFDETKGKISAAQKGVKKSVVICPHCNKSGGAGAMKRWHGDNCGGAVKI